MKVICVNNEYVGLSLTVGRWYEVGNRLAIYDLIDDLFFFGPIGRS